MLLQVWSVHTCDSCHSPLSVFSNPPRCSAESRRQDRGFSARILWFWLFFFLFFGLNFHPHESDFQGTFRPLRFQKSSFKVWRFSENRKSEFFGARRFPLKDFSSEEVNPWCLNSILCWKLLLPVITSDILNSIFQTQPSRMVIKSVGLLHLLGREFGVITVNVLTEICSFDREVWNWLKKRMIRIVNLGCV